MVRADYDSPWKNVLERFFESFMLFLFPRIHRQIDWSKGFEFLDKELQKATRQTKLGRRTVDKLVRVYLKDGGELWVLIHIEVQGQFDPDFGKRVFVCNCRLFELHDRPVASLVVLSDPHPDWRPREFGYNVLGSSMRLRFPSVKLLDFDEQALLRSRNPFALVVLAHLRAMRTRRAPHRRMAAKLELLRLLLRRGYAREEIEELLRYIDWVLVLPEEMEKQVKEIIDKEEKMGKKYVTSWERIAKKEGQLEATRANICDLLEVRFGTVREEIVNLIGQINDAETLRVLLRQAALCGSLDAFVEHLSPVTVA